VLRFAFLSMGLVSFLFTFTLLRDAVALLNLAFFKKPIPMYGTTAALSIVGASLACLFFGKLNARFVLKTPSVSVPIPQLPAALQGFKIVQLSDIHLGTGPKLNQVRKMVDQALALSPDLLVLTGDVIDGDVRMMQAELQELARLKAPMGTYYVLGNHEYYWNREDAIRAIREIGMTPLINDGLSLEHNGASIWIAGMDDPTATAFQLPAPFIPEAPAQSSVRILLSHQPYILKALAKTNYHLQLSGHTHNGQFFPWNHVVKKMYPIAQGLGRFADLWVYVSAGTGYWGPPIRLGTSAEIAQLILTNSPSA